MLLYVFAVILVFGIAGIFSNYYTDFTDEILLGILGPILVGVGTVFFIGKHSNEGDIYFKRMLIRGLAFKFIFYGLFILIIFTLYSFNPIPFMCSFAFSFVGLHMTEAIILNKIQGK